MTWEDAKHQVAREHGLRKTLVTGHLSSYWEEAARLYARGVADKAFDAGIEYVQDTEFGRSSISKEEFMKQLDI